ncbi:MAG: hypothetical protein N4A57_02665 [Anaeromicrobium sp.]|jgi:hypothetical protein|uniref:hypothetical protein n=1 Tax=Anaeromicrobium sp. TaxID=1929132 RepID=UPI0025E12B71|nr:hypothetical protein [Anaeromicrobium sp.]MCT4593163.1 hypothetical protein [Anaeromicrobium sp.]
MKIKEVLSKEVKKELYEIRARAPVRQTDKKKIELGDSVKNLMKHRSYKRVHGRIRQVND